MQVIEITALSVAFDAFLLLRTIPRQEGRWRAGSNQHQYPVILCTSLGYKNPGPDPTRHKGELRMNFKIRAHIFGLIIQNSFVR
jgi:hypothetical protein